MRDTMQALFMSIILATSACYDDDVADYEYPVLEINHFGDWSPQSIQLILWGVYSGSDELHVEAWIMNCEWHFIHTDRGVIVDWFGDGRCLVRVKHLYTRRTLHDPEVADRSVIPIRLRRGITARLPAVQ
jgi:hypothetical protein